MKTLKERDIFDLLELTFQLFGRMIMHDTKIMHDNYWEARTELENRIKSLTQLSKQEEK